MENSWSFFEHQGLHNRNVPVKNTVGENLKIVVTFLKSLGVTYRYLKPCKDKREDSNRTTFKEQYFPNLLLLNLLIYSLTGHIKNAKISAFDHRIGAVIKSNLDCS